MTPAPADRLRRRDWRTIPVVVRGRAIPWRVRVSGPGLVKPAAEQPPFLLVGRGIKQRRGTRIVQRDSAFLLPAPALAARRISPPGPAPTPRTPRGSPPTVLK